MGLIILIEASPRRAADGVAEVVRLAGGGSATPYYYGGNHYRAGVVALPTIIAGLDFAGEGDLGTGGVPSATQFEWSPAAAADLAAMAAYYWPDADVTVRIGPEGALPPIIITGTVLDAVAEDGRLKISLADPAAGLKKPLTASRYAGTGGLEGPAEWAGKIKRRLWGRVWNVPGEPIDKAYNIYCFADPTKPLSDITALRDMGAAAAAMTSVAWAGSTAATLTALRAAVPPTGGGVKCPSIGCVKWWTQPAGSLTADIKGEVGAGYVETAAQIAERIVQAQGGPAFGAGQVTAAAADRPAPVGWVVDDESTTVAAMLDDLLGSVSLLWVLDSAGAVLLRKWAWGASAAAVKGIDVARRQTCRPLATRKLGYKRNELPMARGDIAGIVLAGDVTYADGTPVEALKPAEAGATYGAPGPAPVGSITASDVASTINSGGGVAANQVATGAVQSDGITKPYLITSASYYSFAAATKTEILSVSIVKDIAASLLEVHAQVEMFGNDSVDVYVIFEVQSGGSPVMSKQFTLKVDGNGSTYLPFAYEYYFDGLSVGSYDVKLFVQRFSGNTCSTSGGFHMRVREFKR